MEKDYPDSLLRQLYQKRFNSDCCRIKNLLWSVLCKEFLQQFIKKNDIVLDLGAGYCEFINNIDCGKKIAVDIDPYFKKYASSSVTTLINNVVDLKDIPSKSIDVIFVSEVFEHLNDKNELVKSIKEIHRALKEGGTLLVICPNINFLDGHYWDFLDHILPLNHNSLSEALVLLGFKIGKILPRFLPYTIKSSLPKKPVLLKLYLKMPVLWSFFGKQMFIVATKAEG